MAKIEIRKHPDKGKHTQVLINGVDFSDDTYANMRLVEVGAEDPRFSEVGLQVTFSVETLEIDNKDDQLRGSLFGAATAIRDILDRDADEDVA